MKTYTQYKLTDAMLRRLSATRNGRQVGGTSMQALERRRLVVSVSPTPDSHISTWKMTEAGVETLRQARQEGW